MAQGMERFFRHPTVREFPMALEVVVTDSALAPTDIIGVQELNTNEHFHKSVRWSPRIDSAGLPAYPQRGDRGLLIISDQDEPWLVEWNPYG